MKEKPTLTDKISKIVTVTGTAILLNLAFLVCCIPVVTIGPAWCGLMNGLRYNIRGDGWFQGFVTGFKRRFWRSTVAWLIALPAVLVLLNDIMNCLKQNATTPLVGACVMLAITAVLLHSALVLNVYIPTSVSNWIRNTVNLAIKSFLLLLIGAALVWAPVLLFCFEPHGYIYELVMVLLFAYFALAGLVTTVTLKDSLVRVLIDCRADGILTAEEGLMPMEEDDDE